MDIDRLNIAFTYRTLKPGQLEKNTILCDTAKGMALLINQVCPDSREKSLAITKLEECIMWANASMARNE